VFVNSQYRINDNVDWYAFANYGERDTSAAATWRTALTTPFDPPTRSCAAVPRRLPAAGEQHVDG
jgi:iron complex outermembrane receptor protein